MIYYTITNNETGEILRVFGVGKPGTENTQYTDPENTTLHQGSYSPRDYTYNTETNEFIALNTQKSFVEKSDREMIIDIYNQMMTSGFYITTHVPRVNTKTQANALIDQAAGRARMRYVSQGMLIDQEYTLARRQAIEYLNDTSEPVPELIQHWADLESCTPEQACDNIIGTADLWEQVLTDIRTIRLNGKQAVKDCPTPSEYASVIQPFIDALDAIEP